MIMDIQAEKLYVIEQVARLKDADVIQQLKRILEGTSEHRVVGYDTEGRVMAEVDLVEQAKASNLAIEKGKTKTISEIRSNIKKW